MKKRQPEFQFPRRAGKSQAFGRLKAFNEQRLRGIAAIDYAKIEQLAAAHQPEAVDYHDKTAQEMGISRRQAKALNFWRAYGGKPDAKEET